MIRAGEIGLDPLHRESRPDGSLASQLQQRLARVDGKVGDANSVSLQRVDEEEVLVPLARAQAHDFERAGMHEARQIVRGLRDERPRPHVVAVGPVRAERQPGPHGQRKPIEEFLGEAARPKRRDEFVGEIVLSEQSVGRDHGSELSVDGCDGNPLW
ncbi:MAG: hypothetical protein DMD69_03965 [Gemmatimonadetes bacterium]|nr:MAG: hypothetical protein DMD69_03965 [Gemmatimonadota bacterium]